MLSTARCRKCGGVASYSTLGHMYEASCSHCGHAEAGTFSPSVLGMPVAKPASVTIYLQGAKPSSANLLWLSKLHPKFTSLSPLELKAAFLASTVLNLGALYAEDVERVQKACLAMGFPVEVKEDA